MQSLLHLRNPGTKEPKFPEWMRGDVAFELYTIMCRIKMNWPTDEWMRLEWRRDLKASEPSMYIESLERKCRKVIVDDDGDEMYCDAIFWDRAGLTNHARAIHPRHKIMTREKQDADGKPKKNVGGKINAKDRPAVKAYYAALIAEVKQTDPDFFVNIEPLRATMHNDYNIEYARITTTQFPAPLPSTQISEAPTSTATPARKATAAKRKKTATKMNTTPSEIKAKKRKVEEDPEDDDEDFYGCM